MDELIFFIEGKFNKSGIFNNSLRNLEESLGGEEALMNDRAVCHGQ